MTMIEIAASVQAASSALAFIAALIAVWIAYKAPERAAILYRKHEAEIELRRERYSILRTLMEFRGTNISAPEPVAALNMLVIAFQGERCVLDEWGEFQRYINGPENHTYRMEGYMKIIVAIAKLPGYPPEITVAMIDQGYYPQR